jgi:hypothetical protein
VIEAIIVSQFRNVVLNGDGETVEAAPVTLSPSSSVATMIEEKSIAERPLDLS